MGGTMRNRALVSTRTALAAVPLLTWTRRRREVRAIARVPAPRDVAVFVMPAGPGRAALAVCRAPREVAAAAVSAASARPRRPR
ncbi:hypothetical protein [Micromonospora sp. NPDC023633]|uniref:hypothetical protein n=1 Tax=Micromonospora sp. NPDC023633 TaxID=3154320 RepID=UPI0033FAA3C5